MPQPIHPLTLSLLTALLTCFTPAQGVPLPLTGTVAAWGGGSGFFGQTDIPPGLSGVTAVAARANYTLALRFDGTVVAWGHGSYGETNVPGNLTDVVAIAAGEVHAVALKRGGTVVAWGWNGEGETTVPVGLVGVTAIAAGGHHTVALKQDGTLVAWGDNNEGQSAVPAELNGITAIAAGLLHTVALKSDGTIVSWGDNSSGQSAVPADLSGVTAIAAGRFHTLALKQDGTVIAWGDDSAAQTSLPAALNGVTALGAGDFHSLALKQDGTIVAWGDNSSRQTAVPAGLIGAIGIAAGAYHSVAVIQAPLITAGPVSQAVSLGENAGFTVVAMGDEPLRYQWRKNGVEVSGATNATYDLTNVQPDQVGDYTVAVSGRFSSVTSVEAALTLLGKAIVIAQPLNQMLPVGRDASLRVVASGTPPLFYQWRRGDEDVSGATGPNFSLGKVRASQAGGYSVVVSNTFGSVTSVVATLTVYPATAGTVLARGHNGVGLPEDLTGVTTIAAGLVHTLALKQDGTVVAWGDDSYGQSTVPEGLSGVTAIAAGGFHSAALKLDGTVVAWGRNSEGQTSEPADLGRVAVITAGRSYTVALKQDGTVVAWGDNTYSQLAVPAGLSGVAAIAARDSQTLALRRDGTVVAWGTGPTNVPADLRDVTAISAGANHAVALKHDGTVVVWGNDSHVPLTRVPAGLTGVTAISAGGFFSVALKQDGRVVAWGEAPYGLNPADLSGVTAISAGEFDIVVLTIVPSIAVQPMNQVVTLGQNGSFNVVATGGEPLSYQWRKEGVNIPEATNAAYSLTSVGTDQAGIYTVVVSRSAGGVTGSVTSVAAMLTVMGAPIITTQPGSKTLNEGLGTSFSVEATGAQPLTYQWHKDDVSIPEATNSTYTLPVVQANQAGGYTVVVANSFGSVTSAVATLEVVLTPLITAQPLSQTANEGESVSLGVEAVGAQPLIYQWRKDGVSILEATNTTYTLPVVQANQAGGYTVVVANSFGSVTSAVATLAVVVAPIITTQPESQTLKAGQNGWLTLSASGTPPLFYHWTRDGVDVDGATGPTFSLGKARPGQAGSYTVVVSNNAGSATSVVATISVYGASFGAVVAWRASTVPEGLTEVTDIAAGAAHSLALKQDGTVVAWGSNGDRQTRVPAGLSSVAAIAAGSAHSVALTEDGTVVVWGEPEASPGVAAGIGGAAIAAGYAYTLVLKRDSTVMAWGDDLYGDTRVPVGLNGVTAIAAGGRHAAALKQDGTVVAWGWNQDGQTDIPADLSGVTAIAAGAYHTVALKQDGTVVAWGRNTEGQTAVPAGLREVTAVAAGWAYTVALKQDGTVVAWGDNTYGETDVPVGLKGVIAVAAGGWQTVAIVVPPPVFTAQPTSQTLSVGQDVLLTAMATGQGLLGYQWRKDGLVVMDATNATYTLTNVQPGQAGSYTVVVNNLAGSVTSEAATVTVVDDAIVTSQPRSQSVLLGQRVTLLAAAAGALPRLYQWYFNSTPLVGANSTILVLTNFQASQAGAYAMMVINGVGSALSEDALLTVVYPPTITQQPEAQSVAHGASVTFAVGPDGTPPFTFQWLKDGLQIPQALNQNYTLIGDSDAIGDYQVIVRNPWGSVTSAVATLSFLVPPEIIQQPSRQRAPVGGTARFTVRAHGSQPFTYQWRRDGLEIESATTTALTITNLSPSQSGRYDVVVKNPAGMATSDGALLTVVEPSRLVLQRLSGYPLLTFHGTPGNTYTVQYSAALTPTNWLTLVVFPNLASTPRIFVDITPATNQFRFYRAVDE